jgi:hypothetical protein
MITRTDLYHVLKQLEDREVIAVNICSGSIMISTDDGLLEVEELRSCKHGIRIWDHDSCEEIYRSKKKK